MRKDLIIKYFKIVQFFLIIQIVTGCDFNHKSKTIITIEDFDFIELDYLSNATHSQKVSNQESILKSQVDSIIYFYEIGDYSQAMDFLIIANSTAKKENNEKELARILNLLGLIQWRMENSKDAMLAYQEAAEIAERIGMRHLLGLTHTNRGLIYKKEQNYEQALFHNNKAIRIFKELDLHRNLAIALNNQGQIFKNQEINDSAKYYYQKALENYHKVNYSDGTSATYYNLSEIFMREGQKEASLEAAYKSLTLGLEIESKVRISEAYLRLSETYEYFNELDSALKYYKLHHNLTRDLLVSNQSNTLAMYQAKMGAEVKSLRIQNLEKEKELEANKFWFVIISICIFLFVVAFFLYRYFTKIKFKKRKLELDLLNSKKVLDVKEQELKTYILNLTEKNIQINKLKEELLQGVKEKQINEDQVAQLLEQKILTEEDWENFKSKFNSIYPWFFSHMRKIKAPLTEAEVRFMVLSRLNLSGKEMAKILGISPQSVRVCKMRLKKKLRNEGYQTVEEFLQLLII